MSSYLNTIIPNDTLIVLASSSPRRKKILESLSLDFKIVKPNFDEDTLPVFASKEYAIMLSLLKAKSIQATPNSLIIAADTIVIQNDNVLNKPKSKDDAISMLNSLSNTSHKVVTAITLIFNDKVLSEAKETLVTFRELKQEEISMYVESGSPLDKAGSYGIQDDYGATFVSKVEGCYYNVVGFPIELFFNMLISIFDEK
jgi:septum formation protein